MSYIDAKTVAVKRAKIKDAFPAKDGWKFSISGSNHSSITVTILKGPVEFKMFKRDPENANGYRSAMWGVEPVKNVQTHPNNLDNTYDEKSKEVLFKIWAIVNEGNHDNSDLMTDYFDIGYFTHVNIGDWKKPYEVVAK